MMNRLSPLITTFVSGEFMRKKLNGRDINRIAASVGRAVGSFLTVPNRFVCTLSGTAGPFGTISSTAVTGLSEHLLASQMILNLPPLKGRDSHPLVGCLSAGLARALQTMVLTGNAAGIGPGTGVGKFVCPDHTELSVRLSSEFRRNDLRGRDAEKLIRCISRGLIQHLQSSVVIPVVSMGTVLPAPPAPPVPVVGVASLYTELK